MTNRMSRSGSRRRAAKTALAVGFLALAFGVLRADAGSAGAYEVSIYWGTPAGFWVGVGLALAVSLVISFAVGPGDVRTAALVLGGMTVTTIAGLPVLREYYFYGTADALTHLGWARDMATGAMAPTELFYPGIHSFAAFFGSITGIGIERSVLYVVLAMTVVMIVFVPLTVRMIAGSNKAVVLAAFSTFMLFMVHNLGIYLHAHSFAQATFFSALVLFLAFGYLTGRSLPVFGGLLVITLIAVVLFHPQQAANLILLFGSVSLVQFIYRRYRADRPIAGHRSLYVHSGVLAVAFAAWILRFEGWAFYNLSRIENTFFAYLGDRPPIAGGSVKSQATSLSAIGSGIPEIFVKLFLVATIYTLLSGALVAIVSLGRADESEPTGNAVAVYLGIAALALLPLMVAYFVGNINEHYLRHLGFLLLIATIVGSLALTRIVKGISTRPRLATAAVVIVFAIMLPLSLATAFPSPFMHKQSQHVTEEQIDGYDVVFEINNETLPLAGIREGPRRYSDAVQGSTNSRRYETVVTNENLSRLGSTFEGGGALVVTDYDVIRETEAYQGLRYTDSGFRSLDSQSGVNQVVSNGALRLYHVGETSG